jgi:hypothetical protein
MVAETIEEAGERHGAVTKVARQLGIGTDRCATGCARPSSTPARGPG